MTIATTEAASTTNAEPVPAKKRNDATLSSLDRKIARFDERIAKMTAARERLSKLREFSEQELARVRDELSA